MKKNIIKALVLSFAISTITLTNHSSVYATEGDAPTYYLSYGSKSTKKDNGFTNENTIDESNPHFGWNLGRFYVTNFTDTVKEDDGTVTVLKTPGDNVTLSFKLEQDINKLNGNSRLKISEDTNGYDKEFGVSKSNFGKGTLIVRYTNYENHTEEPTVYNDYLKSVSTGEADASIQLSEEGDYEVTLDYEILKENTKIGKYTITQDYYNYKISFKFSLRNGNCMIYPFDVKTKKELANGSITPNGFYLDLAKSRYLNINIEKQILNDGATGLVEDTRFNKVTKDGDIYKDEGIYIITATNPITNDVTTKKIYVGNDDILKAYVNSNMTLDEINELLGQGATVTEDGQITFSSNQNTVQPNTQEIETTNPTTNKKKSNVLYPIIGGGSALLVICLFILSKIKKAKKKKIAQQKREQKVKELVEQEENNTQGDQD